jgi:hypothetical protein
LNIEFLTTDHTNEERRIYRKERQDYAKTAKASEFFASFARAKPLCVLCGKFLAFVREGLCPSVVNVIK